MPNRSERAAVDRQIAEIQLSIRLRYPNPEDWVFANPAKNGKQRYWPGTFATLLKANGEDIKTVQELLRHANF